jgi:geranylgeranyl diphosphate synthase type II
MPRSEGAPVSAPSASLDALRQRVDDALDARLPTDAAWPSLIHRAMRYSLFAGGKRIRPLLVLAAGEAIDAAEGVVMPLACAVEMIHTYSLIHDDLPAMDDDDLRRGKPTCHKAFGEAIAILAGDALLTLAFEVMADAAEAEAPRRLRASALLAQACGTTGLIGGQVDDLESEGRDVDAASLERLHRAKTGALLSACVRGAGVLAGADAAQEACLARYGAAVGLAFQIVDDVLDGTEPAEQLGKTAGKDQAAGKATYVRLHGLERSRAMAAGLLEDALAAVQPLGPRAARLQQLARLIVERRA